jgi:hypothetical protein
LAFWVKTSLRSSMKFVENCSTTGSFNFNFIFCTICAFWEAKHNHVSTLEKSLSDGNRAEVEDNRVSSKICPFRSNLPLKSSKSLRLEYPREKHARKDLWLPTRTQQKDPMKCEFAQSRKTDFDRSQSRKLPVLVAMRSEVDRRAGMNSNRK